VSTLARGPYEGRRRVVVTGLGAVNAIGLDVPDMLEGLRTGRSGAAPIQAYDASDWPVRFACEAKDFDPTVALDRKTARRHDRFAQFAVVSAREAVAASRLQIEPEADRIGTSMGSGIGGMNTLGTAHAHLHEKGVERFSPFWVPSLIPNMGAALVSMELGTRGPLTAQCTACAASAMAIGDAMMYIRDGRADVMLAGGAEAPITPVGIGGFHGMRAMSTRNEDPTHASRPFELHRDGLVMGEAGAVLVLEELEHARARGAEILAELVGYGLSSDALHVTEPDPTGVNPRRAVEMALQDGGLTIDDVDYINAHGTSTPVGDAAESRMLEHLLGDRAVDVPVSSTKSMTGHTFGAAGATEAVISVLAIQHGFVPPTINYETPDPECRLDYVPNTARQQDVDVVISNGFGFGGHNACLAFRRFRD
jgi:3-oxoacyl-[acyl-carrier-protein] synthase II